MKITGALVSFCLVSVAMPVDAIEMKDLVLPGSRFGKGWELTQPNILGSSAAGPNYINRSQPNLPVIMINIIKFPSPQGAQRRLERKMALETTKREVQRLADGSYETVNCDLYKRYVVIGEFWLVVGQFGTNDHRSIFVEKYTEHIKRLKSRLR